MFALDSSNTDIVPFDVRLCLVDRSFSENSNKPSSSEQSFRMKSIDLQPYERLFNHSIDQSTSPLVLDEIFFNLKEVKSLLDNHLPIEHMKSLVESLENYLLTGNRQLIDETYDLILKYLDRSPQHSSMFYASYLKCLLSTNSIVFQTAIEHCSSLIIYFQSNASDLFTLLLKQGLINKIDVTTSITQAIRLLNLHRYDPLTYSNLTTTTMMNNAND